MTQTHDDDVLMVKEWLLTLPYFSEDKIQRVTTAYGTKLKVFFPADVVTFSIHVRDGRTPYLGGFITSRSWRVGENWHRGNDLPDGDLTREVFDRIITAAFSCMAVAISESSRHLALTPQVV